MLDKNTLQEIIQNSIHPNHIEIDGDGYHYQILVVSDSFQGLNRLNRQKLIYKALKEHVASGELHALTLKSFTQDEWKENSHG